MTGIVFEPTITFGLIIQTVILGTTIYTFLYNMKNQLSLMKNDIEHLEEAQRSLAEAFKQLGNVLTSVAVQDNRINMLEKRLDELAHGKGIVADRS
jgi:DNA repair ATPase RecN